MRRWRIFPKISYCNYRKKYPDIISDKAFKKWFNVAKFWHGRIINFYILHHELSLDFRKDWLGDMFDGGKDKK